MAKTFDHLKDGDVIWFRLTGLVGHADRTTIGIVGQWDREEDLLWIRYKDELGEPHNTAIEKDCFKGYHFNTWDVIDAIVTPGPAKEKRTRVA